MLKATKTGTWPSNSPASGPSGTFPPKQLAIILGKNWKWLPWSCFYIIHIVHPLNDACLNRSSKALPVVLPWKRRSTSGVANLEELSPCCIWARPQKRNLGPGGGRRWENTGFWTIQKAYSYQLLNAKQNNQDPMPWENTQEKTITKSP